MYKPADKTVVTGIDTGIEGGEAMLLLLLTGTGLAVLNLFLFPEVHTKNITVPQKLLVRGGTEHFSSRTDTF